MRSIEFFTFMLPNEQAGGQLQPSRHKLTRWQAVGFPGARCVEESREVRLCPESADERRQLGVPGLSDAERDTPRA